MSAVMAKETHVSLSSFRGPLKAAIIGSSGGIGAALCHYLQDHPAVESVVACSRRHDEQSNQKVVNVRLDLEDEGTVAEAAKVIASTYPDLDLVIIATGILHHIDGLRPEKTWRTLDARNLERVFRINTIGPALIAKHFLPLLARNRKSVFAALSARVGSISDNQIGGWHAYRASKAALNMLIKNFAIELKRQNPQAIAVSLHPGTTDTALSKPFQANVAEGKAVFAGFRRSSATACDRRPQSCQQRTAVCLER